MWQERKQQHTLLTWDQLCAHTFNSLIWSDNVNTIIQSHDHSTRAALFHFHHYEIYLFIFVSALCTLQQSSHGVNHLEGAGPSLCVWVPSCPRWFQHQTIVTTVHHTCWTSSWPPRLMHTYKVEENYITLSLVKNVSSFNSDWCTIAIKE